MAGVNGGKLTKGDFMGEGNILITATMDPQAKKAITDFLGSLNQIVKGDKLGQYFDNLSNVSSKFAASLQRFKKESDNIGFAKSLVNDFNALEGIAQADGKKLQDVLKGIAGGYDSVMQSVERAKTVAGSSSFDGITAKAVQDFVTSGRVIEEWGANVKRIIEGVTLNTSTEELQTRIKELNEALAISNTEKDKAAASSERYRKAAEQAAEAERRMKETYNEKFHGDEYQELVNKAEKYNEVVQRNVEEVQRFIEVSKLGTFDRWGSLDQSVDYSGIQAILDTVERGSMTADEAIVRLKEDYGSLIDLSNTRDVGEDKIRHLESAVQETVSIVRELKDTVGSAGFGSSDGHTVLDRALGDSEEIRGDTEALRAAQNVVVNLLNSFAAGGNGVETERTAISGLVAALKELATVDVQGLTLTSDILRRLPNMANIRVNTDQMDNLSRSLKSLAQLSRDMDFSALTTLTNVNLSGFSNLSVSKASMSNLATYLPQITGSSVDIDKLRALTTINLSNFNKNNLSVSNAAFKHLQELVQTIQGVSNTPVSGPNLSGLDSAAQTIDRVTQKVKQEKEAYREGNEAKKEDVVASEAAAKAEAEKAKISELLTTALKREEEASRQNSAASEQDAERARRAAETYQELLRIQNEIGNRQVTLAGLNTERDAQQITALTNSIRTLQGQYDALFQQSGADLFEAQSNRLTRGFEQIALRVEEVRGRISDLSNSTAEADKLNVALTAVNNTLRSVESEQARMRKVTGGADTDYYHSLTELAEQLRGLRDSGGSAAALTSGLKELKLTYAETLEQANLFKIGVNEAEAAEASETRESSQHAAALEQLTKLYMQVEQARAKMAGVHSVMEVQEYEALAQRIREVQAADQAETMTAEQLKAVYAQLHQTFTEVNAAAQPLIQQSRDRAAAEKEEAASIKQKNAEDKKATAEEQKRASMVKTLNGIIRQCTDAEKKYAAVRNAPNLRQYFDEFKNGAAKAQELKDKLESGEPITRQLTSDFNDLRVSVDNATTSMQTKGNVFQNYITSGMEQLASRMKYSLGLAAMVYKAVGEVKKMVSTAVELDSAMNTLQIVTRASGAEMEAYGKRVSSMAKETAQATKDLIDATTVYARLGYSMDESAILSKYTAMLQSVGDIDASSAQNAITAIIKAFDKGVNDIEDVMDKMVLVGNGFPISVAQIAEGMNNAGSMLNVAGNSFEESIALLTAANSTIQNISKASTGLRTIAARIRKTTTGEDDEGEIVEEAKYQEMINALTRHHVDLIDKETNQYRSTYEIIKDIAAVWGELTSMEQAAVVEALAGTRQQNIFASLMTQFGTAEEAVEQMKDSAGELQEAYDIRMESIQAHINTLKAAFDELAMKVVNSDFAKGVVDIVTKIIEGLTALIDKIGGVGVALAALGGLAAVKFITGGGLTGAILSVTKTVLKLGEAFAMLPELLAVAGIVASIAGLVAIVKELKKRYDEAHPSFELAQKLLDEASKKVDELNGKLETNKSRIRELEELYRTGDFTVVDEAELRKLEAENTLLETQLEIQKGIEAYRAKQVHDTAVEKANTLLGNNADEYPLAQTIQNAIDNYRQAQKDLEDAQQYLEGRGKKATKTDETYVDVAMYNLEQRTAELDGVLQDIGSVVEKLYPKEDAELIEALTKAVADFTDSIDGNSKKSKKWAADLKDLEKRYGSNLDALKRLAKGEQVTREEGEKLRRWMLDCRYTAEDLAEMLSQMGDELSEEQSATGEGNTFLDAQISKWGTMSDEIERARKAIEDYNNAMQGGNNGDIAAQMEEAWKKAVEDIDSGRIDSRSVWAFAEMAMSPQQIANLGYDAAKIAQVIKSSFYQEMFKDEENDDGYSYGQRLLHNLEANISNLEGVSVWRDDSGIHYWIDDFAKLAEQLGISEGFLDALLDDLDAYGSQLLTDTKQNTELIKTFLGIKANADDAREAMKEFIAVTFANDKDVTDTTMARILQSLHDQGYLDIDPSEYYKVIGEVRAENEQLEEDNPTVTPELDDQPLVNDINNMMTNIQNWLNNHPLVVSAEGGDVPQGDGSGNKNNNGGNNSSGSGSKPVSAAGEYTKKASAGGKRSGAGGGDTLVNELGPELISDQGRAFIANGGRPGFVRLSDDAIVFTAEETKDILRGKRNVNGKALAQGNVSRGSLIDRLVHRGTPAKAYKYCPECGASNSVTATRCSRCGSTFLLNRDDAPTSGTWTCAFCGASNLSWQGSCYNCGHGRYESPTQYTNPTDDGPWWVEPDYTDPGAVEAAEALRRSQEEYRRLLEQQRIQKIRDARAAQDSNDTPKQSSKSSLTGTGGGNHVGGADYQSAADPQKVDWVAVRINRLQRTIADLEKIATSGFKKLDTRLRYTKDQISNITDELKVQQQAYDRYIQEANSIGLSESIAANVREGTIDITKYDDDTRKKIDEYTEWYEKALDAKSALEELHQNIAQLYVDSFDMVQTDFENQLAQIEHDANMTSKNLEMAQTKGYLDSATFYEQLVSNQADQVNRLNMELDELNQKFKEAMDSGEIEENSEAWYTMKQSINEVEEAIADANIQLIQYQRTIRQLDWSYFDYAQERFSQMTAEAQFFVDLMSNHELFQDNGQFNNLGEATAGMHAVNYDVYMAQADEYAKQIQKIQRDLESDPYDTELISRREQLLQLQQQSILSAEGEKNAVKDLVQNGINLELQALKDLIDAYNDSLDSAKDLYEYQKSITEKTADIASIQKQLSAYQNDASEETRARVQKLTQNLEKAQTELRETEWDRSISDQKKLLDDMYDEYEDYLNQRLDNIDLLMQEMITGTNINMDSIRNTLIDVGEEVGYTMTDQMTQALSADLNYYEHMSGEINSVQVVLSNIYDMVAAMARASGAVKAYATGGLVDYTGLAAVHGSKGKPELMLNASDTANFLEAAKMMREMAGSSISIPSTSGFGNGGGMTIGQLQVNIPIDRVLDYNDLISQLRDDPKFERLVNAMTLDRAVGKSAFGKNKIVF